MKTVDEELCTIPNFYLIGEYLIGDFQGYGDCWVKDAKVQF